LVQQFTGISDPYEAPADADIVIDPTTLSPDQAATTILRHLEEQGYLEC
jgi:sulfate adenylyltransferase